MAKLIDITGKAISGEWGNDDETGNGIPVLRTTNFTNTGIINFSNVITRDIQKKNISEKYLRNGDIIIEKSGGSDTQPVGRVIFFEAEENKYLFNNFTGLLRVKDKTLCFPKYLFYFLFSNYQKGGTIPFQNKTTGLHNLKTDDYVKKCDVPLPPLKTQHQIAANLDKVTHTIDLCNAILEKLDLLVKSRFVEMFGEPVYNTKHFTTKHGIDIFKLSNGKPVPEEKRMEDGIPAFGGNGISWYTDDVLYDKDTLVIGRVGFQSGNVHYAKAPLWVTDNAMYISEMIDNNFDLTFLCDLMEHIDFTRYQDAGDLKKITQKPFMNMEFIAPPLELQKQYVSFVEQTDKSKLAVKKLLEKAETLKKALMQEYFG